MVRRQAVFTATSMEDGKDVSLEEGLSIYSGFLGHPYADVSGTGVYYHVELPVPHIPFGLQRSSVSSTILLHNATHGSLRNATLWMQTRQIMTVSLYVLRYADGCEPMALSQRQVRFSLHVTLALGRGSRASADSYHALQNHFMHKVLTSHRQTLPLSLVAVFVAIANRLGIPASAIAFPRQVHAFIPLSAKPPSKSPWTSYYDEVENGVHLDVFESSSQPLLHIAVLLQRGTRAELRPSSTRELVRRAGRNIMTSAQLHQQAEDWEQDAALYAVFCILLVPTRAGFGAAHGFVEHIMSIIRHRYPMDVGPIVQTLITPALFGAAQGIIQQSCDTMIEEDRDYAVPQIRNNVRYFVGMVFVHRIFEYVVLLFPLQAQFAQLFLSLVQLYRSYLGGGRRM